MYNDNVNTAQLSELATIGNQDNGIVNADSITSVITASVSYCPPISITVLSLFCPKISVVSIVAGCVN